MAASTSVPPTDGNGHASPHSRLRSSMLNAMASMSTPGSTRNVAASAFDDANGDGPNMDSKDPEFSLPWDFRSAADPSAHIASCSFVTTAHFWRRVQWALQFALVSCLPAAILKMHPDTRPRFVEPSVVLSFCVVNTNSTVGRGVGGLFDVSKALVIIWVLLSIVFASDAAQHWALWGGFFLFGTLFIGFFTEAILCTKNAMLLFTIGMVVNWTKRDDKEPPGTLYATCLVRDVCLGMTLGALSALLPLPHSDYHAAEASLKRLVVAMSICIMGVAESVFCESNLQRTANLVKIRASRAKVDEQFTILADSTAFAWYEPYAGLRVAELEGRIRLLREVTEGIDALIAVVQFIQLNPDKVDSTPHVQEFRTKLGGGLTEAAQHVDKFLHILCWRRKSTTDVRVLQRVEDRLHSDFQDAMAAVTRLVCAHCRSSGEASLANTPPQSRSPEVRPLVAEASPDDDPWLSARRPTISIDAATPSRHNVALSARSEPLDVRSAGAGGGNASLALAAWTSFPRVELGFFVFNLVKVVTLLKTFEEPEVWSCCRSFGTLLTQPFKNVYDSAHLLVELCAGEAKAKRQLLYAAKLSFAMTSSVALILALGKGDPVSGPAVIAFVAGGDTTQTVQGSIEQLMGTVIGSVAGFLLASIDDNITWLVIAVTLYALLSGFFRSSQAYAMTAFFSQFAAFNIIKPDNTAESALVSIQQNVGAIAWYFIISAAILPHRPSVVLFEEMKRAFELVKGSVAGMEALLSGREDDDDVASATDSTAPTGGSASTPPPTARRDSGAAVSMAMERAIDANIQQQQAITAQKTQLQGASIEPSLAAKAFPGHLVDRVVQQQQRIAAILAPLSLAWSLLADRMLSMSFGSVADPSVGMSSASQSASLMALLPHLKSLVLRVEKLMSLLTLVIDRDVASLTPLLIRACMSLQRVSSDLAHAEHTESFREARRLAAEDPYCTGGGVGAMAPVATYMDDVSVSALRSPALLTVVYCCTSLAHELFQLYLAVSEMRHAMVTD